MATQVTKPVEAKVSELLFGGGEPEPAPEEEKTEVSQAAAEEAPPEGDEDQGQAEEPGQESPEEDLEEDILTIAQLAKELGIAPEELYGLTIGLPGSEEPITLSALKDEYVELKKTGGQVDAEVQQKFEQEKQAFEAQRQAEFQKLSTMHQGMQQVPAVLQQLQAQMGMVQQVMAGTDWATREKEDPGAAALDRQKLQEQMMTLQQQYGAVQQQIHSIFEQAMTEGRKQLLTDIPEWREPAKYDADRQQMLKYAAEFGVTAAEVAQIMDPRVVRMLRDAALRSAQNKEVNLKAKETRRKGSPTLKPGAVKLKRSSKKTALREQLKKAKASPDMRDKISAVTALLTQ